MLLSLVAFAGVGVAAWVRLRPAPARAHPASRPTPRWVAPAAPDAGLDRDHADDQQNKEDAAAYQ